MEFKQVVGARRSIRYYLPYRPVERSKVQTILQAARLQSQHGNASAIRKAVVVTKGETPDDVREAMIEALYNQPAAAQAPVMIVWTIDMAGWATLKDSLLELIEVNALNSNYGWSEQFIDEVVMQTPDFNVLAGDQTFAKWLSAIEMGAAIGAALLAAVDAGLGTQLLTGNRDRMREILGMPDSATAAQIQLVGYPAESSDAGGQRPRPDFESLYFDGVWGTSYPSDPDVDAELAEAGMLQEAAPKQWRKDEIRAMSAMFGLPD